MTEENRRQAEKVRHALGEFLDRLANAVFDSLARSKHISRPIRRRSAQPPKGRVKPSG